MRMLFPTGSSLPNSFGISLYSLAKGHGLDPESSEARELLDAYARSALSHRVSLHGMRMAPPPFRGEGAALKVDFSGYDEELGAYLSGKALPSSEPRSELSHCTTWPRGNGPRKSWPSTKLRRESGDITR